MQHEQWIISTYISKCDSFSRIIKSVLNKNHYFILIFTRKSSLLKTRHSEKRTEILLIMFCQLLVKHMLTKRVFLMVIISTLKK